MIVSIRIRQYARAEAIYAFLAVAATYRELSEDARRFFGSFEIGTTHRKKTGPEATAKVLAGWAMWLVAAAAAVSGSTEGVSSRMLRGAVHDFNACIDKYSGPRVLREPEGILSPRRRSWVTTGRGQRSPSGW